MVPEAKMNITFILPFIQIGGGVRVVFEYANRLIAMGHTVRIIYPIVPPLWFSKSKIELFRYKTIESFRNLMKKSEIDWFDLNSPLIKTFSLSAKYMPFIKNFIPDADIVIATSWETAYFVNSLPPEKGKKFYFIQHYEIWDLWNDLNCWERVKDISEKKEDFPLSMSYIVPSDPYLKRIKETVDATYKMPFNMITISSWLKDLLEKRFEQKVYGTIKSGVNFDLFRCIKEKDWSSERRVILMPYRGVPWKGDLDGLNALNSIYNKYNNLDIWLYGAKRPEKAQLGLNSLKDQLMKS